MRTLLAALLLLVGLVGPRPGRARSAAHRHGRRLPARRCRRTRRPRRHRRARPHRGAGRGALQRLLRQRLPDPARRPALLARGAATSCCRTAPAAWSRTRPGASGCSTSARPPSARGWPGSSGAGPRAAHATGSTPSSTTTSTPSPAATAWCGRGTRGRSRGCSPRGPTTPAWRSGRRTGRAGTAPRPASTSPSPRSAAATTSAGATSTSYGDRVLVVEYRAQDFAATCREHGDRLAVVLRDRDLTPDGVRRWC